MWRSSAYFAVVPVKYMLRVSWFAPDLAIAAMYRKSRQISGSSPASPVRFESFARFSKWILGASSSYSYWASSGTSSCSMHVDSMDSSNWDSLTWRRKARPWTSSTQKSSSVCCTQATLYYC